MTTFRILSPLAIMILCCGIVKSIHALSEQLPRRLSRRTFVAVTMPSTAIAKTVAAAAAPLQFLWIAPEDAIAQNQNEDSTTSITSIIAANIAETEFRRTTSEFGYTFVPPKDCEIGNKPLKTHLDEVNFNSVTTKGFQFGITVDPVRINTLKEFGTPEQVAARVVLAELNRDGVFDVTLVEDPFMTIDNNNDDDHANANDDDDDYYYILNYLSQGKRGNKHFVCKISIQANKLYVLTAQCKEEDYNDTKDELMAAVRSFKVLHAV